MSFDVLQEKIIETQNPTVAGLDPRIEYVPEHIRKACYEQYGLSLRGACEAIWQFNVGLIDALCGVVPAVKPQAAYYENLGWRGMELLERTIRYAKGKGLFVIADIKRGDIGSTATAYAEGWLSGVPVEGEVFKSFDADCVTLNGYMGSDSIKPFLEAAKGEDKCAFVLVKTSNPGSGELQDLKLSDGRTIYEAMGELNESIAAGTQGKYGFTMAGAVTGATYDSGAASPAAPHLLPGARLRGPGGHRRRREARLQREGPRGHRQLLPGHYVRLEEDGEQRPGLRPGRSGRRHRHAG